VRDISQVCAVFKGVCCKAMPQSVYRYILLYPCPAFSLFKDCLRRSYRQVSSFSRALKEPFPAGRVRILQRRYAPFVNQKQYLGVGGLYEFHDPGRLPVFSPAFRRYLGNSSISRQGAICGWGWSSLLQSRRDRKGRKQ